MWWLWQFSVVQTGLDFEIIISIIIVIIIIIIK